MVCYMLGFLKQKPNRGIGQRIFFSTYAVLWIRFEDSKYILIPKQSYSYKDIFLRKCVIRRFFEGNNHIQKCKKIPYKQ